MFLYTPVRKIWLSGTILNFIEGKYHIDICTNFNLVYIYSAIIKYVFNLITDRTRESQGILF